MEKNEACSYIEQLLNKTFRVHTTDGRIFRGTFKCTDPDKNVVLAETYEYREPSQRERNKAATREMAAGGGLKTVTMDMTSRFLGLTVVPGHHIVKMELEQFASQMRAGGCTI